MPKINKDKNVNGKWLKSYSIDGISYLSKSFSVWDNILRRCDNKTSHKQHLTYKECTISENFKDYQYFANWYVNQIGYGIDGYDIDKDILLPNNKCYCEEYCVLIPQELNKFLLLNPTTRGNLPLGVSYFKRDNNYTVRVSIDNKPVNLGYFDDPETAHIVYKNAKENEAKRWYKRLVCGEFVVDSRVIERIKDWKLE